MSLIGSLIEEFSCCKDLQQRITTQNAIIGAFFKIILHSPLDIDMSLRKIQGYISDYL